MKAVALAFAALLVWAGPAGASSEGASPLAFVWQTLNFVLLVAVLFFVARKPVREFLASRRAAIRDDLDTSAELLAEAEARLGEWKERTTRLDAELASIRDTSRRLAEEEHTRILAQARAAAERIRRDAGMAAEREAVQAREALRAEAAELAVELAGRILREGVGPDDQQRLFDEFLERVASERGSRPAQGR